MSLCFISLFGASCFFTLYAVKRGFRRQVEMEALAFEKQQAELNTLKAQVNPHFLFNTLNTVYANALKKDGKTPEPILKLADSYRYLLHERQHEQVAIEQEIQHLGDYIHLQEERLAKKVTVRFSSDLDDEACQIAPLLLIGFIENAFKYTGILKGVGHFIDIDIRLRNNVLRFYCENPYEEGV